MNNICRSFLKYYIGLNMILVPAIILFFGFNPSKKKLFFLFGFSS